MIPRIIANVVVKPGFSEERYRPAIGKLCLMFMRQA